MTGKENNPISVEDAKKRILKSIKPINKTEKINTKDCLNRILSKSIKAKRTQPEFNTSAMDGYAIRKSFLKDLPKDFNIIGETQAGSRNKFKLKKNQAVRVFTGSFLPEGCDKVILQENCHFAAHQPQHSEIWLHLKCLKITSICPNEVV